MPFSSVPPLLLPAFTSCNQQHSSVSQPTGDPLASLGTFVSACCFCAQAFTEQPLCSRELVDERPASRLVLLTAAAAYLAPVGGRAPFWAALCHGLVIEQQLQQRQGDGQPRGTAAALPSSSGWGGSQSCPSDRRRLVACLPVWSAAGGRCEARGMTPARPRGVVASACSATLPDEPSSSWLPLSSDGGCQRPCDRPPKGGPTSQSLPLGRPTFSVYINALWQLDTAPPRARGRPLTLPLPPPPPALPPPAGPPPACHPSPPMQRRAA